MIYNIGDSVRLETLFVLLGVGTNPTAVVLTIWAPDDTVTTPAPTSDGSGAYHSDLALTQSGIYRFKWAGTGAVVAVEEGTLTVQPSALVAQPPEYVTFYEMIVSALRLIRVMGAPMRKASPEEMQEGLYVGNAMLSGWLTERLMAYATIRQTFPTVIGQGSYTIGINGTPDIDMERPSKIERLGLLTSTNHEEELRPLTPERYAAWSDKATSGEPSDFYYSPTVPNGIVRLLPIPSLVYTAVLYIQQYVSRVASLTTQMSLPDGQQEAIEYNLALRLAPRYKGAVVSQEVKDQARSSKYNLKRVNRRDLDVQSDYRGGSGSGFNIETGAWR